MQLPDVFLQVKVPAEALATGGAGEGLLVVVRVHVESQVVHLVERLAADGALKLLLPTVRQLVVLVVSCRGGSEQDISKKSFSQSINIEFTSRLYNSKETGKLC